MNCQANLESSYLIAECFMGENEMNERKFSIKPQSTFQVEHAAD